MPTPFCSPRRAFRIRSIWTGTFCFACVAVIQLQLIQEGGCASAGGLGFSNLEEDVDRTEVRELHRKIITDLASWKCLSLDAAGSKTLSGFKECMEPLVNSVKHSWSTDEEKCRLVETIQTCFSSIWARCLKDPGSGSISASDADSSRISIAHSNVQNRTDGPGPDNGLGFSSGSGSMHGLRCKVKASN